MVAVSTSVIRVAAGVIRRADTAVLLALRPPRVHQGGLWEFPGGKLEQGESAIDGLARELFEELGIRVNSARPLIRVNHAYPEKAVELEVMEVCDWRGSPHGREGQGVRWALPDELPRFDFPAANRAIVSAVRLPSLGITASLPPRHLPESLLGELQAAFRAGIRLLVLACAEEVSSAALSAVAALARAHGVICQVHLPPYAKRGLPEDLGRHWSVDAIGDAERLPVLPGGAWRSAQCAHERELAGAAALGVDFVIVDDPAAGAGSVWRELACTATMPLYLGGIDSPRQLLAARTAGCQGVVVTEAAWRAASATDWITQAEDALAALTLRAEAYLPVP